MKMNGVVSALVELLVELLKQDLERLIVKETTCKPLEVETTPIRIVTDSEHLHARCDMKPYLKWTAISVGSIVTITHRCVGTFGQTRT